MKRQFKLSASILTLALSLAASTAFAAQVGADYGDEKEDGDGPSLFNTPVTAASAGIERTAERKVSNPSGFLEVVTLSDTYEDSGSLCMSAQGEIKANVQKILSDKTGHHDVRRILQLDGGGVRGLFSILELCVLEEIINLPFNQEAKSKVLEKLKKSPEERLYIRDLFDVGTGTSTGSILTAGLFATKNLSAIDVAKFYTRYGHKIFDENKRYVMPGINMGVMAATYGNEGLQDLLAYHFGNASLRSPEDLHRLIYIIAFNEHKQQAAVFSSLPQDDDEEDLHKTPLASAVASSCAAQTFLPGILALVGRGHALMSDGGIVANNSAHMIFQIEKKRQGNPFEIYSFGTGLVPAPEVRAPDSGAAEVVKILMNALVGSEKLALQNCINEINGISSQLYFFARINPKLEVGMDKLDDTSSAYVRYAMQKAFSVTQGPVFAEMVHRLGFQMPDVAEIPSIHREICNKLDTLKSKIYKDLDPYEKEFVIKKVLALDFGFYEKRFVEDLRSPRGYRQMDHEEVHAFLQSLMKDIAVKQRAENGWLSKLWSVVTTNPNDKIVEFIPRCAEFHKISYGKNTLDSASLDLLTGPNLELTQEQLEKLSPGVTIQGNGWFYKPVQVENSATNELITKLLRDFVEGCEHKEAQYQYENSQSPYAHLPALIFWKNALHKLEETITRQQLGRLKENLVSAVRQVITSRSVTGIGPLARVARSSRYDLLVTGLDTYIDKFYKG
ncbi:MAG: patatin [Alphaproteobacteria bacterium]|jgi:hypothetical protein|nr:patatin [Alphaproteobacteria bacterium]